MSQIQILQVENQLVVDSRIIAEQLGIEHKTLLETIRKYQTEIESDFGRVTFKTSDVQMPKGGTRQEVSHALLTEDQSLAILSLSRNTPKVVQLKFALVKQFQAQKRLLEDDIDRELRKVQYEAQQKALPTRAEIRETVVKHDSCIFTATCYRWRYPVRHVHDYITVHFTRMTASQLRDIGWVDGAENIGLNHIVSLRDLQLVSIAKRHFANMKQRYSESDEIESWQNRANRAIDKAKKEV